VYPSSKPKIPVEETIETKKQAPVNWSRSRKVDLKHIAIVLRFDWPKKQAYGVTSITFSPFSPTNQLMLDAAFFTINAVAAEDGTPLKFEYNGGDSNDNLKITLNRVCRPGEDVTVKVDYRTNWVNATDPNNLSGSNGKGLRFFEQRQTIRIEPERYGQWEILSQIVTGFPATIHRTICERLNSQPP
ncbi:MAG TPA: hypothetical protein VGN86_04450, partial [Pyrinomonadaceae bacterium]|nr:hypothetical protein [Pyrinomonadaceae bacterium]